MTELLIEKFYQARELTGARGVIFAVILSLFVVSLLSDAVYQTATTASSAIKFLLVIALGISFGALVQDISLPRLAKPINKKLKQKFTQIHEAPVLETVREVVAEKPILTMNQQEIIASDGVLSLVRADLQTNQNEGRAIKQREFFATKADSTARISKSYLGVNISDIVSISETHAQEITLAEIKELMTSDVHDERIIAIWLLINSHKHATVEGRHERYNFYLEHRKLVDNWDMVDLAARNIIGAHVAEFTSNKTISDQLITSESVWDKRTAVMSAHPLLISGDLGYAFSVVERLIDCDQELVQSALGWVLKEAYKKDSVATENFIKSHFQSLSNQAIRIGTERMEKNYRKAFMRGEFETVRA